MEETSSSSPVESTSPSPSTTATPELDAPAVEEALSSTPTPVDTATSERVPTPTDIADPRNPEDNWVEGADNIYDAACQNFRAGKLRHEHLETYRPIIADICKDFKMNYDLVEVRYSPLVDRADLDLYVQANVFSLTYWDRFTTNGLDNRHLVILMEEEKNWWNAQLDELINVDPVWFGPSTAGGHCYAAEAEAFCPKTYYGNDGVTTGDFDVLATMLGSKMNWSPQRKVVAIHESTHAFQT